MNLTPTESANDALEAEMVTASLARFRQQRQKDATPRGTDGISRPSLAPDLYERQRDTIAPLADAIREHLKPTRTGTTVFRKLLLNGIEPEELAYLTVAAMFRILTVAPLRDREHHTLASVAAKLGALVEQQMLGLGTEQAITEAFDTNATEVTPPSRWPVMDRHKVGAKMVDLMERATGFCETRLRIVGPKHQERTVELTAQAREWIEKAEAGGDLMPCYRPMVVPPVPWTTPTKGGYRTLTLSLISESDSAPSPVGPMPVVYDAVNAVQNTAWKVNGAVLAVLEQTGLLLDLDVDRRTLAIAQAYRDFEAIYFPHQLDFRGRVYARPDFLKPQGNDVARGLLTFSHGMALTDDVWLAYHGANCFGQDKLPLDDRAAWVRSNTTRICGVAADPLAGEAWAWWTTADKPYQFLAFCFEWAAYQQAKAAGRPFESSLPVHVDGSCNGLQHYGAMLRDAATGEAVNLVPNDAPNAKPQDIYQRVADALRDRLHDLDDATANKWLKAVDAEGKPIIGRKLAKSPVMTLAYGSTEHGRLKAILKLIEKDEPAWLAALSAAFPKKGELSKAVNYLNKHLTATIEAKLPTVLAVKDWFDTVADTLSAVGRPRSKDGKPVWSVGPKKNRKPTPGGAAVTWTVPLTGFRVTMAYPDTKEERVKIRVWNPMRSRVWRSDSRGKLVEKEIRITYQQPIPNSISRNEQRNGLAPNFVHSMDACHLMLTVNQLKARNVPAVTVVHDGFGVHAQYALTLQGALRETFNQMYSGRDVLADFRAALLATNDGLTLDAAPALGDLDVAQVLGSSYFFA